MKKNILYNLISRLMLLVGITTMVGCADDPATAPSFEFAASPLSLEYASAGDKNLAIYTTGYWSVESDKDWVSFDVKSGKGDCDITVTVAEGGVDTATISIYQTDSTGGIIADAAPLEIPVERQSLNLGERIYYESLDVPGALAPASPYPFISIYDEWYPLGKVNEEDETIVNVLDGISYEGTQTTIRRTGVASRGYFNASGLNRVFFATAPAKFIVKEIPVNAADKMYFSFGVSTTDEYADEKFDYELNKDDFTVELSDDGTNWLPIDYNTKLTGSPISYWVHCFLHFSLENMDGDKLYIRFTSKADGIHRLDDVSIFKSNEESVTTIDLSAAVEDEAVVDPSIPAATATDIADVNAAIIAAGSAYEWDDASGVVTPTPHSFTTLGFAENIKLTGVVVNDPSGKNFVSNSLIIATDGSTDEYNGISIVGAAASPFTNELEPGDKVEVTLMSSNVNATNVEGVIRVVAADASADWVYVKKVGTGVIGTKEFAADAVDAEGDFLKPYQGMYVKVNGVAPAKPAILGSNVEAVNVALRTTGANPVYTYAIKSKNTALSNVSIGNRTVSEATALCGIAYKNYDVTILPPEGVKTLIHSKFSVAPRTLEDLGDLYDPNYDMRVITIPYLYELAADLDKGESMIIDETMDRLLTCVITTDQTGGNIFHMNTHIATPGSPTTPNNGILLMGSNSTNLNMYKGEVYEFTLQKGKTTVAKDAYGYVQLYNNQNASTITRVNTGVIEETVPVVITSAQLGDYLGQVITVKDATTAAAGTWGDNTKVISTALSDLYGVFYACTKGGSTLRNDSYLATTSDITGIPVINGGKPKITPRTTDDVKGFKTINSGDTGEADGSSAAKALKTTIADIVKFANDNDVDVAGKAFSEDKYYYYEAVVTTDHISGKGVNSLNLYVGMQDPTATTAGNGIFITSLSAVNTRENGLDFGKKIKVIVPPSTVKVAKDLDGGIILSGYANSNPNACFTVLSAEATAPTPIDITSSLADYKAYQGMYVTVKSATTTYEGPWCTLENPVHTIIPITTDGGGAATMFVKGNTAVAFKEGSVSTGAPLTCYPATGDVTGVVLLYRKIKEALEDGTPADPITAHIAPQTTANVEAFMTDSGDGGDGDGGDGDVTPPTGDLPAPGATEAEAVKLTIPQILKFAADNDVSATGMKLSDTGFYYYEAIVTTDYVGGNMLDKEVGMQTPGATEPNNGIFIKGMAAGSVGAKKLYYGNKIKVIIPNESVSVTKDAAGCVRLMTYVNSTTNPYFSVLDDSTTSITPINITALITEDNYDFSAYQGMYVIVDDATTATGGDWCSTTNSKQTLTPITVNGYAISMFVKGGTAKEFKDGTAPKKYIAATGDVSGVVTVYANTTAGPGKAHIAPQEIAVDVPNFVE